jgi:hypothetical protein
VKDGLEYETLLKIRRLQSQAADVILDYRNVVCDKSTTIKKLSCQVIMGNKITGNISATFDGEYKFQECIVNGCNKVKCIMATNMTSTEVSVGITARLAIQKNPELENDPIFKKLALID